MPLLACAYGLLRDRYRRDIEPALAGDLWQIRFRPHVDREYVAVTDPEELTAIRSAVVAARPAPLGSYPEATCHLEFVYAGGRVVKMRISATGMTATNFFRQDPASVKPLDYVTLRWDGHYRIADGRPFDNVLRRQGAIAASQPATAPAGDR
jgi:hypothetical protein